MHARLLVVRGWMTGGAGPRPEDGIGEVIGVERLVRSTDLELTLFEREDGRELLVIGGEGNVIFASILGNPGDSGCTMVFGTAKADFTFRSGGCSGEPAPALCMLRSRDFFDILEICLLWSNDFGTTDEGPDSCPSVAALVVGNLKSSDGCLKVKVCGPDIAGMICSLQD